MEKPYKDRQINGLSFFCVYYIMNMDLGTFLSYEKLGSQLWCAFFVKFYFNMSISSSDIEDIWEKYIITPDTSISGLMKAFLVFFLFSLAVVCLVNEVFVLDNKNKLLIIFISWFGYLPFWLLKRRCPIFGEEENGILLAFNKIDLETEQTLKVLYKKIISDIESERLSSKIKIKLLPSHIKVSNEKNSSRIREKSKAKIIIWGDVEAGNINSIKKDLVFSGPIRFTYEYRLNVPELLFFNQNISNIILQRDWSIDESEQIIKREYVARNIKEISLYLIGMAIIRSKLSIDRKYGAEILIKIFHDYQLRDNLNKDEEVMLKHIEYIIGKYFLDEFIYMNFRLTDKNNKGKLLEGRYLLDMVMGAGIDKRYYILAECIIDLLEGNASLSFQNALIAMREMRKESGPYYSLAFLSYYMHDLKNGFVYLKRAIRINTSPDLSSIISWYQEAMQEDNSKNYLNFPIGQIYYNLLEEVDPKREIAKESLNKFVIDFGKSKDETIKQMLGEAILMLNKIK